MPNLERRSDDRPVIGFGPKMPGSGSWEWVGADIAESLSERWNVKVFNEHIPDCDLFVFIKYKPRLDILREIAQRSSIIYCPIDFYSSAAEIDNDSASLIKCQRVLIHCERLRRYFAPYVAVEYIDHHVKYAAPLRKEFVSRGPLLWVGVRSNLPPLVEYVNSNALPGDLWILTNPEEKRHVASPDYFGFRSDRSVRIECWTPDRHLEWTGICRAAFDVKAGDFLANHKSPAKAIDFITSGVPLAIQAGSSTAEHLSRMGFSAATLEDPGRWLSRSYWGETIEFGKMIGQVLKRKSIADRFERVIEQVLSERTLRNL